MESTMERKERHNEKHLGDVLYSKADKVSRKALIAYKGKICSTLVQRLHDNKTSLMFIIDDFNTAITGDDASAIKVGVAEIAFSEKLDANCDVLLASDLWSGLKSDDPAVLEILRDFFVIHDNGFVLPLQDMLVTGKIRPSKESVNVYFLKAERSLKTSNEHISKAVVDLYWAVIDSAHAAVMIAGITPPSPKDLAEVVRKELVLRKLVNRRCADIVERFYDAAKAIMHRQKFEVSGREFDSYMDDADFFLKEIRHFVNEHIGKV